MLSVVSRLTVAGGVQQAVIWSWTALLDALGLQGTLFGFRGPDRQFNLFCRVRNCLYLATCSRRTSCSPIFIPFQISLHIPVCT